MVQCNVGDMGFHGNYIVLRKILIFSIGLGREPRQMNMAVLAAQEDQGIMTKNVMQSA